LIALHSYSREITINSFPIYKTPLNYNAVHIMCAIIIIMIIVLFKANLDATTLPWFTCHYVLKIWVIRQCTVFHCPSTNIKQTNVIVFVCCNQSYHCENLSVSTHIKLAVCFKNFNSNHKVFCEVFSGDLLQYHSKHSILAKN